MSASPRLVIFDVDGTLVDSQRDIVAAMEEAFGAVGLTAPARGVILSHVGLSLDRIFPLLVPELASSEHDLMERAYKSTYMRLRAETGAAHSSPLYPGAREVLEALRARPDVLLGVATGKSRRGLDRLIEGHGLEGYFFTRQVADYHPSKPHPSMILQALSDCGLGPEAAVMVGDTSFDMEMAQAAGVSGIGVGWGYHPPEALTAAARVVESFVELPGAIDEIWKVSA